MSSVEQRLERIERDLAVLRTDLEAGRSAAGAGAELRRLEARLDARLQEINARVVLHDGRFAALGDRINQSDRRNDALSARIDSRMRATDQRFNQIETRLDEASSTPIVDRPTGARRWLPKRRPRTGRSSR